MKALLLIDEADEAIAGVMWHDDADAGPILPQAKAPIGMRLLEHADAGEFTREGRGATEVARLVENVIVWQETASLEELRANAMNIISDACRSHIEMGFQCAALGEVYLYPANAQDQANLVASVTDSLMASGAPEWNTPFWCATVDGLQWEFRPHTAAQIQQVGREGKASILAAMQKNEILRRQIAVASAEELKNITW